MEKNKKKSRKVITSVQNALDILNLFDDSCSELGNAEIAKKLNMNPGTVAGHVYTLKVNKYLDQNPDTRKYRLGLKIVERASVLLNQLDLRKIATPYLEELRDWCGESVNLAILDDREVVYIERIFGHPTLGIRTELGKRAPIHSTSLGKAIAANLPKKELQTCLSNYEFFSVTPFTITDKEIFLKELDITRGRGYAIDEQENELGGRCVGAPVFGYDGYPKGAISISIPVQRFPIEKIPEYGNRLLDSAKRISQDLGYI